MYQFFAFISLYYTSVEGIQWERNLPNPSTQQGYKDCNLESAGLLCDPDGVLLDTERSLLNSKLLNVKTITTTGVLKCDTLTIMIAIVDKIKVSGVNERVQRPLQDLRAYAEYLRDYQWNKFQPECYNKNMIVIYSAISDKITWTAYKRTTRLSPQSSKQSVQKESSHFKPGNHLKGLMNMVDYYTTIYCTCTNNTHCGSSYMASRAFSSSECSSADSAATPMEAVAGVLIIGIITGCGFCLCKKFRCIRRCNAVSDDGVEVEADGEDGGGGGGGGWGGADGGDGGDGGGDGGGD